jgi:hypothetical protein
MSVIKQDVLELLNNYKNNLKNGGEKKKGMKK